MIKDYNKKVIYLCLIVLGLLGIIFEPFKTNAELGFMMSGLFVGWGTIGIGKLFLPIKDALSERRVQK